MVVRKLTHSGLLFMGCALLGPVAASNAEAQSQPPAQQQEQSAQQPATPAYARAQPDPEQVETAERECRDRLQTVEAVAVMPDSDELLLPRGDLNTIREAALAFARAGHQQGCEEVTSELQTLLQDRREAVERELELQRARQAIPVTQLPFTVTLSDLVGSDVVNHDLQALGKLEDLILTDSAGRYALIEHGGFLGIGKNYTPVALERLLMTEDRERLVVHVAEEAFSDAPEIDPEQIGEVQAWSSTIDQWWVANVGPQPQPPGYQPAPTPQQPAPPPAEPEPQPAPPAEQPAEDPAQQPAPPPAEPEPQPAPPVEDPAQQPDQEPDQEPEQQ